MCNIKEHDILKCPFCGGQKVIGHHGIMEILFCPNCQCSQSTETTLLLQEDKNDNMSSM